jgi:hypothetical protein
LETLKCAGANSQVPSHFRFACGREKQVSRSSKCLVDFLYGKPTKIPRDISNTFLSAFFARFAGAKLAILQFYPRNNLK